VLSKIFGKVLKLASQPELYYKFKTVIPLLDRNPKAVFLDCGCGDGEFTLQVAERVGTNNIFGIEVVEPALKKSKERGLEVYSADLNLELPFPNESFDVILANQVIEHISYTDKFLREAYRVLKVGGYIIVATVNLASSLNILYLLFGKQPPSTHVSDEVVVGTPFMGAFNPTGSKINKGHSHIRVFTLVALKELLEYHEFQVEKSVSAGYYPFPVPMATFMSIIDKQHSAYITVKARKNQLKKDRLKQIRLNVD
jgi:ubiquinone/menaquinone biosynthesis C-methylase UbiE